VFQIPFRKAIEEGRVKGINPAETSIVKDWIPKKQQVPKIYLDKFQVNAIFQDFQEHSMQYFTIFHLQQSDTSFLRSTV